jgi:hypothetical protein
MTVGRRPVTDLPLMQTFYLSASDDASEGG